MKGYGHISSDLYRGDAHHTYYTYDVLDRLTKSQYNGSTKTYYYGTDGRLAQTTGTLSGPRTLLTYDAFGRLLSQREYNTTNLYAIFRE